MMLIGITLSCLFCQCTKDVEYSVEGELIITKGCCFPDVTNKYFYPIQYGTEEWNKIHPDEWINACQLPDEVLKSISSLGLIRSFIDTPYPIHLIYLTASHLPLATARGIYFDFNSLNELLIREDGAQSLMIFYAATKLDCVESLYANKNWNDIWNFSYRLTTIEYLFTLPEIIDKLSLENKKTVVEVLLANYRKWLRLNNDNPQNGHNGRLLTVMVWLMYDDMLPSFDRKTLDLLKENTFPNEVSFNDICDGIIAYAEKFIVK